MNTKILARALAATAMLAIAGVSTPAMAQAAGRVLQVPCCRCLDGSKQEVSINTGTAGWTVARPNTTAFSAVVAASNAAWAPLSPAAWVGPSGAPTTLGNYTYQLQFNVPRCTIGGRVSISGRFLADNSAQVFLDTSTTPLASSLGQATYGFRANAITPFSASNIGPGTHTLRVVVNNASSVTALALQGTITMTCPNSLTMSSNERRPDNALASAETGACGCTDS